MAKRRIKKKKVNSAQAEVTRRLKEASGIFRENPLCDPEQRKSFYDLGDVKAGGVKYYGKERKKKDKQ